VNAPADDPFATLGIAVTSDLAAIKRAYFAALQRHPPHADPEGFRRIRTAYERLSKPGAVAALAWSSGFDVNSAFQAVHERLGVKLAAAVETRRRSLEEKKLHTQFEEVFSTTTWTDAVTIVRSHRSPK